MRRRAVDHLLLSTADNIRYATDYRSLIIQETGDHMVGLIDNQGQAQIFGPHLRAAHTVDPSEDAIVRSVRPLAGWVPLMAEPERVVAVVAKALTAAGARSIGYDMIHPELLRRFAEALPSVTFTYVGADLFDVRREKLPAEVQLMRQAHQDNLAALKDALALVRPGSTDRELLAAGLASQQGRRAEAITHFTCFVRSPFGDWFPAGRTLRKGEAIFIDQVYYGPGGYASDLTRTAFVGEPPAAVLDAYSRLLDVAATVREQARAGAKVSVLDELLNSTLQKMGLAPSPYGLGHGIGLRVMEPPSLIQRDLIHGERHLLAGEVIALEPETAIEHGGEQISLKVEDCFLVESSGLTSLGEIASLDGVVATP